MEVAGSVLLDDEAQLAARYSASFSRADDTRVDGARFFGVPGDFFDDFFAAATGGER